MAEQHDVVVIGAGLAGLCCAGELVRLGLRPLLISETREVGAVFAVQHIDEHNWAFVQHLTWQQGWGGGWWYNLARALNIPVRLYPGMSFEARMAGTGQVMELPVCVSAAALAASLAEAFGLPDRNNLSAVLAAALSIPFAQLPSMHRVPMAVWLAEQGADEATTGVLLTLAGFTSDLTIEQAAQHLSVFGGIGLIRLLLCGEGHLPIAYPDIRAGLCVPIADAVQNHGGEVWRGRRVERVCTSGGRVTGVALADGTEIFASTVAIAAGNPRIPALLDPLPPELVEPLDYTSSIAVQDFNLYLLLDHPVAAPKITGLFDQETRSITQLNWSLTDAAPWTTEPGKQIMGVHTALPTDQVAAAGGTDAIYGRMLTRSEEMYPALGRHIEASARQSHRHHWLGPITIGPKIPRTVSSVDGLWFVGDGSAPTGGIWTEAAASCGILGARAIAEKFAAIQTKD